MWVVGADRAVLRDAYHSFLRLRWSASIGLIALAFVLVNLVFAVVYQVVGGVEGLRDKSFFDAFVFSVQTIGTIGYGVMHPKSDPANIVMIVESIAGIIFTAVVTGLVFAKFSRTTGRIAFSKTAVVCMHDGVPTLMFRVGNQRSNVIVEATLHVVASYTHMTKEGNPFYRLIDLELTRNRMGGMRRGWVVMHPISEASPFHQLTAELAKEREIELEISLLGFDDVTLQTVHAMHHYGDGNIMFGRKFAESLTVLDNGDVLLDMTKFHETIPE
ncbi:MAG TPA: ion channel [Kofleriaceae bacterium]|jgi:inward rectifier potassium channel